MVDFNYTGEFLLKDGSLVSQDLEQHGWATPEFLENISTFTLVPKVLDDRWPLLRIRIPDKAKPVWKWRTFRETTLAEGGTLREMRIYGIGYKKRGSKPFMMWVIPGGHVEAGFTDNPGFADQLWHAHN